MKKILLSILQFEVLFVPCYLAISFFEPDRKARLLENGIVNVVVSAAIMGLIIGTVLMGGLALVDKFKKKEENEEQK